MLLLLFVVVVVVLLAASATLLKWLPFIIIIIIPYLYSTVFIPYIKHKCWNFIFYLIKRLYFFKFNGIIHRHKIVWLIIHFYTSKCWNKIKNFRIKLNILVLKCLINWTFQLRTYHWHSVTLRKTLFNFCLISFYEKNNAQTGMHAYKFEND